MVGPSRLTRTCDNRLNPAPSGYVWRVVVMLVLAKGDDMARKLHRTAAFTALAKALMSGARGGPSIGKRFAALPRMVKATAKGQYDGGMRVAMMAAATAYVVSPVDLVPEAALFVFGLADDAVMITWLAGAVLAETTRFLEWEKQRDAILPGSVVD